MKRDEVDRRVKEDEETYSAKFSEDTRSICTQVLYKLSASVIVVRCISGNCYSSDVYKNTCTIFTDAKNFKSKENRHTTSGMST